MLFFSSIFLKTERLSAVVLLIFAQRDARMSFEHPPKIICIRKIEFFQDLPRRSPLIYHPFCGKNLLPVDIFRNALPKRLFHKQVDGRARHPADHAQGRWLHPCSHTRHPAGRSSRKRDRHAGRVPRAGKPLKSALKKKIQTPSRGNDRTIRTVFPLRGVLYTKVSHFQRRAPFLRDAPNRLYASCRQIIKPGTVR